MVSEHSVEENPITQQWHQNHWNQHQKHLLLKLLLVLA